MNRSPRSAIHALSFLVLLLGPTACGVAVRTGTETGSTTGVTAVPPTTNGSGPMPGSSERERLDAHRRQWEAKRPARYVVEVQEGCFCPNIHLRLTVENNRIVSTTRVTSKSKADSMTDKPERYTIDAIFDRTTDVVDKADDFTITYDEQYGYPKSVRVDWLKNASDDEFTITVLSFEPA